MSEADYREGICEGKGEGRAGSDLSGIPPDGGLGSPDHAHRQHAVLSASSAKRWLNCPPSARLQERFPDQTSVYAAEGSFMHEICETKIRRRYFHEAMEMPQSEEFFTDEVDQVTDVYVEFVMETIEEMKKSGCEPLVLVEERLDYSHIAPGGFGTGDLLLIGKSEEGTGLLHVIDFKGGRGVFVPGDHNPQMMLYALGALRAYGFIYDIELVRMTIVQPRLENISTCEMTVKELEKWGGSIRPTALLAYEGKGEQKAGDWCIFCRCKPTCRACLDEALSVARDEFVDLEAALREDTRASPDVSGNDRADETDTTGTYHPDTDTVVFKSPALVHISELAAALPTLERVSGWINAVFAYVASEAIRNGTEVPGYKMVEGRSKRIFTDIKAVAETAVSNGYPNVYKQQLITLTEFEKMMGKKKFNELLGKYVVKPPGKLSLVPADDPREAVTAGGADAEFDILPGLDE